MGQTPDSVFLEMWECCSREHPLDRALTLIALADGGVSRSELAELPIAERDKRLFRLAASLFGPRIVVVANCPSCEAETELSFTVSEIEAIAAAANSAPWVFRHEGNDIKYRPPDSRDLARALAIPDSAKARRTLLKHLLDRPEAPEALIDAFDAFLAERAGLEALTLTYVCTHCRTECEAPFDIVDYLCRHLAARAKRASWDIHILARAYGWTGDEILSLSSERRATLIGMVTA